MQKNVNKNFICRPLFTGGSMCAMKSLKNINQNEFKSVQEIEVVVDNFEDIHEPPNDVLTVIRF